MTTNINDKNTFAVLNEVCKALSQEQATEVLLEKIVASIQAMTKVDGASLYIKHGDALRFHIVRNQSLQMALNASSAATKVLPDIPLNPQNNQPISIASHCAKTKKIINIEDIAHEKSINTAPTKAFDTKFNYKTKSVLAIPIVDRQQAVLGVLQLININNAHQKFEQSEIDLCEAMTALLSIVLSRKN